MKKTFIKIAALGILPFASFAEDSIDGISTDSFVESGVFNLMIPAGLSCESSCDLCFGTIRLPFESLSYFKPFDLATEQAKVKEFAFWPG